MVAARSISRVARTRSTRKTELTPRFWRRVAEELVDGTNQVEMSWKKNISAVTPAGLRMVTTAKNMLKVWKWQQDKPVARFIDRIQYSQGGRAFIAAQLSADGKLPLSDVQALPARE